MRRSVMARPNLSCRSIGSRFRREVQSEDSEFHWKERTRLEATDGRRFPFQTGGAGVSAYTLGREQLRHRRLNQVFHRLRRSKTSVYRVQVRGNREQGEATKM